MCHPVDERFQEHTYILNVSTMDTCMPTYCKAYTPDKHYLFYIYAASLDQSTMLITFIGYGNIVPVCFEEYIVCIPRLIVGGIIWLSAAFAAYCPRATPSRSATSNTLSC